jgi:heptosyltransferase-2
MRTLIVSPETLADAVMTQPLVALLDRFDPDGRIDVLTPPSLAPVFAAMAEVAEVIPSSRAFGALQLWGKLVLARRLDSRRHDRAFILPEHKRAALVPWLLGVPHRIALRGDTRWGLVNQPHDSAPPDAGPRGRPAVERFAHLAFDAAHPLPAQIPNPALARNAEAEAAVRARAGLDGDARLLVLLVCSGDAPSRRWPARHWASLVAMAAQEWPALQPVMIGSADDRGFATEVAALSGRAPLNLCGTLALGEAMAAISQAEAVVSHDCGLMHVAAAYSRPMVAVFGPTDPRYAPPRSVRAKVEWLAQECSPCEAPTCRYGHGSCMGGIGPDRVLRSLQTAMQFVSRDIR